MSMSWTGGIGGAVAMWLVGLFIALMAAETSTLMAIAIANGFAAGWFLLLTAINLLR